MTSAIDITQFSLPGMMLSWQVKYRENHLSQDVVCAYSLNNHRCQIWMVFVDRVLAI